MAALTISRGLAEPCRDQATTETCASTCNNPRARALYERSGFVAVKQRSYPFLQRYFGFSAVTEMRRPPVSAACR